MLKAELQLELKKLGMVDATRQEQVLAMAQNLGQERLNPHLLAKYAPRNNLHLPLFRHAQPHAAEEQRKEIMKERAAQLHAAEQKLMLGHETQ